MHMCALSAKKCVWLQSSRFPGKYICEADRNFVELGCDEMLDRAQSETVSFLVVGDSFGATTHADLVLRAREKSVEVKVVHNASILNAVGCTGLQLYRFGQTVSVPFFDGTWRPFSFMEKIAANKKIGLHTLVLLDIKVKEQTVENMIKGNNVFEPPRFMTVNQAIDQILMYEGNENRKYRTCICVHIWLSVRAYFACHLRAPLVLSPRNESKNTFLPDAACPRECRAFGVARVGQPDQLIVSGTLEELQCADFGRELHSLIICADELHDIEQSFYDIHHKK